MPDFNSFPIAYKTAVPADVGLANVDNTSDANKPVSTAQAAADSLRVLKAGDTMTGGLSVAGALPAYSVATTTVQQGLIGTNPGFRLVNTGGATDTKAWDWYATATQMVLRIVNDAGNATQNVLTVDRSGMGISATQIPQGNFGVGGSPQYPMHSQATQGGAYSASDMVGSGTLIGARNNSTAAGTAAVLRLDAVGPASSAVVAVAAVHTGDGASALAFGTRLNAASNIVEAMRIDASRNVGIGGTPLATTKLDLQGAVPTASSMGLRILDTTASAAVQLFRTGATYSYAGVLGNEAWLYSQGSANICIGADGTGDTKIVRNGAEHSRFGANGLGIGGAATSKLTVVGNYITAQDGTYVGYFGKASDVVVGAGAADLGIRTNTGHICFGTSTGAERMRIESGGGIVDFQPHRPGQFTLSTLPSAAAFNGYLIDVTNASGGPRICRSNGSVWQILNTTTTVS